MTGIHGVSIAGLRSVHCFDFCRLVSAAFFLDTLRRRRAVVAIPHTQGWSGWFPVSRSRFNLVSFPLFVVLVGVRLRVKWLLVGVIGLFARLCS